jgi:hypothetical protein
MTTCEFVKDRLKGDSSYNEIKFTLKPKEEPDLKDYQ